MKYYQCPVSQTMRIKAYTEDCGIPVSCKSSASSLKPIRSVHFPNDIVFQDYVRHGELERIGLFIRARRVNLDTIYHSGEMQWNIHISQNLGYAYTVRELTFKLQISLFAAAEADSLCSLCAGMAAIHEAVLSGNLECVKLLVHHGADIHQRDEEGWTPLHMACSDGFPHIARWANQSKLYFCSTLWRNKCVAAVSSTFSQNVASRRYDITCLYFASTY